MNNSSLLGIAFLTIVVSIATTFFMSGSVQSVAGSSVKQQVLKSGTLRAGYIVYPPYITKDPKTGELSGIFYDLTNEMGTQLGLKVEWIEEAGYGTIFADLDAGKYDVYAGGLWASAVRSKAGDMSDPAFFNAVYAYARNGDRRFDNNLNAINAEGVRISTIDGTLEDSIAKSDFPLAKQVSLPSASPFSQEPLQVIDGKADVVILALDNATLFLKANPGSLHQVSSKPLRLNGNSFATKSGEVGMLQMINTTLDEALNNGSVDKILKKYDPSANMYVRVAPAYAD